MTRLLCLFGLHDWERLNWGVSLDCRQCRRCDRFQVVAYGDWHDARRGDFHDVTARLR